MNFFLNINIIQLFQLFLIIYSENTDSTDDSEISSDQPVFPEYELLQKYQSIRVSSDDGFIQFNSRDFDIDEVMHFKMKALDSEGNFYEEKVSYEYISTVENYVKNDLENVSLISTIEYETKDDGTKLRIRYFDIIKKANEFRNADGNLLLIGFYVKEGVVEISNFQEEKSENKLKDWEIVLIIISIIIFFVLLIIIIILCVIKNNKENYKIGKKYKEKHNFDELKENTKEVIIYKKNNNSRQNKNSKLNENKKQNQTYQRQNNIKRNGKNLNNRKRPPKSMTKYEQSVSTTRKFQVQQSGLFKNENKNIVRKNKNNN